MRRQISLHRMQRRFGALLGHDRWNSRIATASIIGDKMRDELKLQVIGVIETPFVEPAGSPIQPSRAGGAIGTVRVDPRFWAGLTDIGGFERIWLIYWMHKGAGVDLVVTPFLDTKQHGIFATRAPARPTPIGLSAVRLLSARDGVLEVADVDMVDGTPLLDIEPYVPEFDCYPGSKAGWFDQSGADCRVADDRFCRPQEEHP